ncbi:hypothetical protein Yalta_073 [Yalta virus]|nr:hypothetical protein Yalta_073 [Yalta virus]
MSLIERLMLEDKALERLFKKKANYTSNIEDDYKLLKEEVPRGYLTHQFQMNFLLNDNSSSILIQNFIQQYLKKPMFKNNIIIKNTTNDSEESVKILLQVLPYEIITAESDLSFFDFLIEISLDKYKEINYNRLCGFYLNCVIKSNSAIALVLDNYITPFIIENDEVIILKKNKLLKKWVYQLIEKDSKDNVLKGIFITGEPVHITKKLISSLKDKLHLSESEDEIKEMFDNNSILIRDQKRESSDNALLTSIIYEDKNKLNSLNRIIFYYYFDIDLKKQKEYLLNVVEHSIKLLKISIEECVVSFNAKEQTNDHIFVDANDNVNNNLTLFKKKSIKNKYNCYHISPNYNGLFKFICDNNDIEFGSNLLCIEKNTVLSYEKCFDKLDMFYDTFLTNINSFFDNDIAKLINEFNL